MLFVRGEKTGIKENIHERKRDLVNYRILCSHYSQLVFRQLTRKDLHGE